jgi:Ca2+-binding RTX toxin-like protein
MPDVVTAPNASGGMDITITDPSQLTASLGTTGIDHVYYSGSGTVVQPDTIENITLRGSANVVGNALGNDMRSGVGQNVLNGMGGNDTLYGYHGSDWVYGGSGNDIMSGSSGQDWVYGGSGRDTVNGGSGNDWVWGDAGRDTVYGGLGNDTVNGGAGNDTLYGNAGRDTFVFDTKLNQTSNVDLIKNFSIPYDSIWLDNAVFTKLGKGSAKGVKLASDMFVTSTTAQDAQDRIVYDRDTGSLYYDRDGTGSAAQVKFATLSNKAKLTYHDFFVV